MFRRRTCANPKECAMKSGTRTDVEADVPGESKPRASAPAGVQSNGTPGRGHKNSSPIPQRLTHRHSRRKGEREIVTLETQIRAVGRIPLEGVAPTRFQPVNLAAKTSLLF